MSNELQSDSLDIVNAIELSKLRISHLEFLKETGFDDIFKEVKSLCELNDFPLEKSRSGRNKSSHFDENEYLQKFNLITEKFISEIEQRFESSNYEPACELYKIFTNKESKYKTDFEKLDIYKNILDLDHLKLQEEAFVIYKIRNNTVKWDNLKELC